MNLIQQAKDLFTSSFINEAASSLGETETGIKKGLDGIIPAVFNGLINKGNSHNGNVMDLINSGASFLDSDGGFNLSNIFASDNSALLGKAGGLLSVLFGDKLNNITNGLGTFAGTKQSSVTSLLTAAVPAIIGLVSKYFKGNNINSEDKAIGFFNSQKDFVAAATPAGLSLGNLFGSAKEAVNNVEEKVSDVVSNVTEPVKKGGSNWLMWLLLLALLALALWFLLGKGCNKDNANGAATTDSTEVVSSGADTSAAANATTLVKEDGEIDLNGTKIIGYKNGMEWKMIEFLKAGNYANADEEGLKTTWYDFDKVQFKMGSSKDLEEGSQVQLDNLVAILKAFPDAKIKIGGYTDKTGDEAVNVKISQDRANFIKDYLARVGVGAQVLGAEGYGSQFATVDASASDEERSVDRKMAIRFAK